MILQECKGRRELCAPEHLEWEEDNCDPQQSGVRHADWLLFSTMDLAGLRQYDDRNPGTHECAVTGRKFILVSSVSPTSNAGG